MFFSSKKVYITNQFTYKQKLGYKKLCLKPISPARRPSIPTATDLRPIRLTFFVLKTLETFLDYQIRSKNFSKSVRSAQYEHIKGRSTDTVLSSWLGNVVKALFHKLYSMATFIVMEGNFNYIHTECCRKRNATNFILMLISEIQTNGVIFTSICEALIKRRVLRHTTGYSTLTSFLRHHCKGHSEKSTAK